MTAIHAETCLTRESSRRRPDVRDVPHRIASLGRAVRRWFAKSQLGPIDNYVVR